MFDKYMVVAEVPPNGSLTKVRYFRRTDVPPLDEPGSIRSPPRGARRTTIAQHARDYLVENGLASVTWGDATTLSAIADRAATHAPDAHPEAAWRQVMDGIARSPDLFEKEFVTIPDNVLGGSKRVRRFRLRAARLQ